MLCCWDSLLPSRLRVSNPRLSHLAVGSFRKKEVARKKRGSEQPLEIVVCPLVLATQCLLVYQQAKSLHCKLSLPNTKSY